MLTSCTRIAAMLSAMIMLFAVSSGLAVAADAAAPAVTAAPAPPQGVQVHGYMQNRFYFAPGVSPEYRTERLSISAIAGLPNDSTAYTEVYYHPYTTAGNANVYLESAYYDTMVGGGHLRVGKGRRMTFGMVPAYPNRKTSNYGIVAEAFTQDRIQGVQYFAQKGVLDAGVSVHNGYRLGIRNLGDIPGDTTRTVSGATPSVLPATTIHAVPHLAFREGDSTLRPSNKPALSARLGGKWKGGFSAGVSQSWGTLDSVDLAALKSGSAGPPAAPTAFGGVGLGLVPSTSTNRKMNVFGLDGTYKHASGIVLQGEYYKADVSDLDFDGWNALLGYEMKNGWKFYARYGTQNMDTPRTANPLSWDTQQLSLSMVQPLRKGLWLQYEYEFNMEDMDAGRSGISNDIGFIELFTGF